MLRIIVRNQAVDKRPVSFWFRPFLYYCISSKEKQIRRQLVHFASAVGYITDFVSARSIKLGRRLSNVLVRYLPTYLLPSVCTSASYSRQLIARHYLLLRVSYWPTPHRPCTFSQPQLVFFTSINNRGISARTYTTQWVQATGKPDRSLEFWHKHADMQKRLRHTSRLGTRHSCQPLAQLPTLFEKRDGLFHQVTETLSFILYRNRQLYKHTVTISYWSPY